MKKGLLLFALLLSFGATLWTGHNATRLFVPMEIRSVDDRVLGLLANFGLGKRADMASAFRAAGEATGLKPSLLIALMLTESSARERVVSSKGYAGVMQVPQGPRWQDVPVNIMAGAFILRQKLHLADGDLELALLHYKGYRPGDQRGRMQVVKVMNIFARLDRQYLAG